MNYKSRFNVYSTRVTYIGLAIAIAIKDGLLNLDDKLSTYLEEYKKRLFSFIISGLRFYSIELCVVLNTFKAYNYSINNKFAAYNSWKESAESE
ncbi:hypothetical protein [Oceanobacillus neutriphilus]|uniref:Uncharacterized protein n=1 Tax=Oceanobacillus neutriphilus TaxID=531815 RepID=A0ABQ2NRA7_9BACI|nr:hypothetical protein [Oceanobacillus neutriphilus]GGP08101.1 hypothetical protein GCM10011346_06800 [Oceanobacillus neutriphilus]